MKKKGRYNSLKLVLKTLILVIIIACVAPFFLKGPDDNPLLEPKDIKLPDLKKPQAPDVGIAGLKNLREPEKIYKWKDKNGVWHFSDKEKPGMNAEIILVEPDRRPERKPDQVQTESEKQTSSMDDTTPGITFPMTISPAKAKKLKQDAEKVKAELENHYEEIGKQIGTE